MFRDEIIAHVQKEYGIISDHPWKRDPDSTVFRHEDNRKWFGLILNVSRKNLGVRRHIVGGANRTLISVKTPSRSCRIGT